MTARTPREPRGERYEIRVCSHLDAHAAHWFEGFTITLLPNGETLLSGTVADQSALFGLLSRIRDLGLPLIAVNRA
jgi:hypothetical protein